MSAFVQDNDHIDLLVTAVVQANSTFSAYVKDPDTPNDYRRLDLSDPTTVGRMLLEENVKSVLHRYKDSADAAEQAEYAARIESYTYRRVVLWDETFDGVNADVAILKAIAGYEYQTCEHPEWESSDAWALMQALTHYTIGRLPGYSEVNTWSFHRQ